MINDQRISSKVKIPEQLILKSFPEIENLIRKLFKNIQLDLFVGKRMGVPYTNKENY